jgi:septal ring factor EnvC (AmiA/AmiB activator)
VTYQQQCDELRHTFEDAQEALSRLLAERGRLQGERHESAVRTLLGEHSTDTVRSHDRLPTIEREIAEASAKVEAVREALRRVEARGPAVREQIEIDMGGQIQQLAPAVMTRLATALAQAVEANRELCNLERFGLVTLPLQSWPELAPEDWSKASQWLAQARTAGVIR